MPRGSLYTKDEVTTRVVLAVAIAILVLTVIDTLAVGHERNKAAISAVSAAIGHLPVKLADGKMYFYVEVSEYEQLTSRKEEK